MEGMDSPVSKWMFTIRIGCCCYLLIDIKYQKEDRHTMSEDEKPKALRGCSKVKPDNGPECEGRTISRRNLHKRSQNDSPIFLSNYYY